MTESIRVAVRLHAVLRRHHPGPNNHKPFDVDLAPDSVASVLIPLLGLPEPLVWAVSVNGEAVELDHPLRDGDRVSFFPPVAGGFLPVSGRPQ